MISTCALLIAVLAATPALAETTCPSPPYLQDCTIMQKPAGAMDGAGRVYNW